LIRTKRDWLIAIAVILAAAALAVLAVLLLPSEQASGEALRQQQSEPQLYQGIPLDAHLLELDKRALSEAYHAQVLKLWSVLLADGARDTAPFSRGMANLRRAYGLASKQIDQREQEQRK